LKCFPIAGGNWNNGTNAGVFLRNLNNVRGNSNNNVGFCSDCERDMARCQDTRRGRLPSCLLAKSDYHGLSSTGMGASAR